MAKLSDVAAVAQVSTKTASRAFNGKPHVSAEVCDRILFMTNTLGYKRNAQVRRFATRNAVAGASARDDRSINGPILIPSCGGESCDQQSEGRSANGTRRDLKKMTGGMHRREGSI